MQVKDVPGVGFSARRASQQERHLSVSHSLFAQIVVDDQRVLAVVSEVLKYKYDFPDGAGGVRSQELQGGGFGGRRCHDDRVLHGVMLFQVLDDVCHRGALLADSHINAVKLFVFIACFI